MPPHRCFISIPPRSRSERGWRLVDVSYLPADVSVVWLCEVPEQFHARVYAPRARTYRYHILNRDSRPGLAAGRATWGAAAPRCGAYACVRAGPGRRTRFQRVPCHRMPGSRRPAGSRASRSSAMATGSRSRSPRMLSCITWFATSRGLLMSVGVGDSPPSRAATGTGEPRPGNERSDRATGWPVPRGRAVSARVRTACWQLAAIRYHRPQFGFQSSGIGNNAPPCPGSKKSCLRGSRPNAARARSPKAFGRSAQPATRSCTAPNSSEI